MSITKIDVIGAICWGGGFDLHAEYQLQVIPTDPTAAWTIYRRYSAFTNLHNKLLNKIGGKEKAQAMNFILPGSNFFGSRFNTSPDVLTKRKTGLQEYLNQMLTLSELTDDIDVLDFLDSKGKGLSGIVREMGTDSVAKECIAQVKIIQSFPFTFWSWAYLVLVNDGTLYVFKSKYDRPSQAAAVWKITGDDIRLVPKADDNLISISSLKHENQLHVRFATQDQSTFWVRTLSDLSSSTAYQSLAEKSRISQQMQQEQKQAQRRQSEQAKRPSKIIAPVATGVTEAEHFHANGTGHTVDELSSLYGV